jgi:hypothetical protein
MGDSDDDDAGNLAVGALTLARVLVSKAARRGTNNNIPVYLHSPSSHNKQHYAAAVVIRQQTLSGHFSIFR